MDTFVKHLLLRIFLPRLLWKVFRPFLWCPSTVVAGVSQFTRCNLCCLFHGRCDTLLNQNLKLYTNALRVFENSSMAEDGVNFCPRELRSVVTECRQTLFLFNSRRCRRLPLQNLRNAIFRLRRLRTKFTV